MIATFQPFVTPMRAARRDALVGVASIAGYRGLPRAGAYCGSKAAAIAYLESLRVEMLCMGVAVVTICPGFIATPMTADNLPDAVPDAAGDCRPQHRPRDRARRALPRRALADGVGGTCAETRAGPEHSSHRYPEIGDGDPAWRDAERILLASEP